MSTHRSRASRLTMAKRAGSPELGETFDRTKYSAETGRPVRKSAGKKTADPNFVDTTQFVEDVEPDDSQSSSSGDEVQPTGKAVSRKKPKKKLLTKRKRSPSVSPPPIDSIHRNLPDIPDSDEDVTLVDSPKPSPAATPQSSPDAITLTFNIPQDFRGPLTINLDRSFVERAQRILTPDCLVAPPSKKRNVKGTGAALVKSSASSVAAREDAPAIGFLSLPPELRNKVYRLCFVSDKPLDFWDPANFCRSSALLRTCKQINKEGCGILYGENAFRFARNRNMRGQYWDARTKEIGYKDMRRFLLDIGEENRLRIRDMSILFEDASPSSTPRYTTNEERRFAHDEQLLECLRIIGRSCQLKSIFLAFLGRRSIDESYTFNKFLGILCRIRADKVDIGRDPRNAWIDSNKINHAVKTTVLREMTRKKKKYANDQI